MKSKKKTEPKYSLAPNSEVEYDEKPHTITVILPGKLKSEVSYNKVSVTTESVIQDIREAHKKMIEKLVHDVDTLEKYRKGNALNSRDFYWWLRESYVMMWKDMLNLVSEMESLALISKELENRTRNGVPVDVQIQVPKVMEKEMKLWVSEREAARKAQRQYVG